jgi:glycosyltransferase involved in cell wall biosynthesis
MNFKIVIRAGKCEKYISRCLHSVLNQTEHNWNAVVMVDDWGDKTLERAKAFECDKIKVYWHLKPTGLSYNIYYGSKLSLTEPDDILGYLDGDDSLTNKALFYAGRLHRKGALITYGSFNSERTGKLHRWNKEMPRGTNHRKSRFYTSHFKTMRGKVFREIPESYFKHKKEWIPCASDIALTMPALDLVHPRYVKHLNKPVYIYNDLNPHNVNRDKQRKWKKLIQAKKPLKRLFS